MGGGEAASGEGTDLGRRAIVMAVASIFGVIAVALPFFYLHGMAALLTSLVLALALGVAIAQRRSADLGRRKAYVVTFGVLAVAIGVTSAVAVLLPGSGG
jgi:VIT1/CCC1 family predicted Fe2+/Mn2+ transporter